MMRTCPTCGEFYGDEALAFCLADGTPLRNIDRSSEEWNEGSRVIEEKGQALRRQERRVKWRRVFSSAVTMLIVTMVVFVVAINGWIYLKPPAKEAVVATTAPVEDPTETHKSMPATPPWEDPVAQSPPWILPSPSPPSETRSPESRAPETGSTETHSPPPPPPPGPVRIYKISGQVRDARQSLSGVKINIEGTKLTSTTTDANGRYSFTGLTAGGSYTITPINLKTNFSPSSRFLANLSKDEAADFVGVVAPDVYKISGRVTDAQQPLSGVRIKLAGSYLTETTTDAHGTYTFKGLRAGGNYYVTPIYGKTDFTPTNRSFQNLTQDETANFTGVTEVTTVPEEEKYKDKDKDPVEECTESEKASKKEAFLKKYGVAWEAGFDSEKPVVIAEAKSRNLPGAEPQQLEATATRGPIRYDTLSFNGCAPRLLTATYEWQVILHFHGTTKIVAVRKQKTCVKKFGIARCV